MSANRIEQAARLVCSVLGARYISITPLPHPDRKQLYRVEVAFPANAEPMDFILEFVDEGELANLPETQVAQRLFCVLWRRTRLAGLSAIARALNVEALDDC